MGAMKNESDDGYDLESVVYSRVGFYGELLGSKKKQVLTKNLVRKIEGRFRRTLPIEVVHAVIDHYWFSSVKPFLLMESMNVGLSGLQRYSFHQIRISFSIAREILHSNPSWLMSMCVFDIVDQFGPRIIQKQIDCSIARFRSFVHENVVYGNTLDLSTRRTLENYYLHHFAYAHGHKKEALDYIGKLYVVYLYEIVNGFYCKIENLTVSCVFWWYDQKLIPDVFRREPRLRSGNIGFLEKSLSVSPLVQQIPKIFDF